MPRRRHIQGRRLVGLAAAYVVLVCAAVGFVGYGAGNDAVPAFAPLEPVRAQARLVTTDGWRRVLEAGFPYLVYGRAPLPGQGWGEYFLRVLAGIRPGDTKSVLDAEMPVLAAARLDVYLPPTDIAGEAASVIIGLPAGTIAQRPADMVPAPEILVGIYHTHARESFLPELGPRYQRPDDAHSDDLELTVVRVGRELATLLQTRYGIGVVHSPEVHDLAGKVGAYVRSELTASRIVREYPSVRLLLDIHRDSQLRSQTTAAVGGEIMARVMLVLGTDHPEWRANYEVAKDLIGGLEEAYPGLTVGIYPKPGRYNQHLLAGAVLLEVGGVENTLEECLRTAAALAHVIARYLAVGGRN